MSNLSSQTGEIEAWLTANLDQPVLDTGPRSWRYKALGNRTTSQCIAEIKYDWRVVSFGIDREDWATLLRHKPKHMNNSEFVRYCLATTAIEKLHVDPASIPKLAEDYDKK